LVTEAERWAWASFVYAEVDWHEESTSKTDLDQEAEYDTDSMVRAYIWRGERNMDGQMEVSPPGSLFAPILAYQSATLFTPPTLITFVDNATAALPGHCVYSASLYFSDEFGSAAGSNLAVILTIVFVIVAAMAFSFFMYDIFLHRRNRTIVGAAANSNAFISTK
jgi:hypothetical protein